MHHHDLNCNSLNCPIENAALEQSWPGPIQTVRHTYVCADGHTHQGQPMCPDTVDLSQRQIDWLQQQHKFIVTDVES